MDGASIIHNKTALPLETWPYLNNLNIGLLLSVLLAVSISPGNPLYHEMSASGTQIAAPNPTIVNPAENWNLKVIGEPVYDANGKQVGFIPSQVKLKGSLAAECREEVGRAFNKLYTVDRESYDFIVKYLKAIQCEEAWSGADVFTGTYRIGRTTWDGSQYSDFIDVKISQLASKIMHDTCHIWQYERMGWWDRVMYKYFGKNKMTPEQSEVECMTKELKTLRNVGYDDWWLNEMVTNPEFRKDPNNRYWEFCQNKDPRCGTW